MKSIKNSILALKSKVPIFHVAKNGELGTEQIKEVFTDGYNAGKGVFSLVDGKFGQAVPIFLNLSVKYQGNFREILSKAWAQVKDLKGNEPQDIYNHVVNVFDITNDELEAKIEKALEAPLKIYQEVKDWETVVAEIGGAFNPFDANASRKAFHLLVDEAHDAIELAQFYSKLFSDPQSALG